MKKKNLVCSLISAGVMLLLPWLAVIFFKGDAGMGICFILFFGINPIYSLCVGLFAGKNIKASWYQPLLLSALFLTGTWLLFSMLETAFLLYAAIYLATGVLTMLITSFFVTRKH